MAAKAARSASQARPVLLHSALGSRWAELPALQVPSPAEHSRQDAAAFRPA
jgi:hypothetical protein